VEWLEVWIVMPSEWLVEQGRIKMLDCVRQQLENERPFSIIIIIIIIINDDV